VNAKTPIMKSLTGRLRTLLLVPVTAVAPEQPDLGQLHALFGGQDRCDGLKRFHAHRHRLAQELGDLGLLGVDGGRVAAGQRELAELELGLAERLRELLAIRRALGEEFSDAAHLIVRESERLLEASRVSGSGPRGIRGVSRAGDRGGGHDRGQD
jgi:hypothetical protein